MQLGCWVPGQTHNEKAVPQESLASCKEICLAGRLAAALPRALGLARGPLQVRSFGKPAGWKTTHKGLQRRECCNEVPGTLLASVEGEARHCSQMLGLTSPCLPLAKTQARKTEWNTGEKETPSKIE